MAIYRKSLAIQVRSFGEILAMDKYGPLGERAPEDIEGYEEFRQNNPGLLTRGGLPLYFVRFHRST